MALPAAVIFDNDGLLLDTEQAWTRAEVTLFARRGREFTAEHKRYLLGSSPQVGARKLEEMLELPGQGVALHAELEQLVMEEVAQGAPAMPGAPELVAELNALRVPLGLASNSKREFVDRALRVSGMAGAFAVTLAGDEVVRPKPAPDIYLGVAERLGVAPGECVALEDSQTGVAAARAAGMTVIGVPSFPGVELPEAHHVAAALQDPLVADLLGLLAVR